ncbi:hypothetical protein ACK3YP_04560 [Aeromonas allosaccharophila]|uniref:tetratricopeptide repeat protein n=1 Tax=Aeromonas allosaccharophila TaxID=656 RepID=UPI003987CF9A
MKGKGQHDNIKKIEQAAKAGDDIEMFHLAVIYKDTNNIQQALRWYEKAVNAGNSDAMNNLGVMHQLGDGVPQSFENARRLYEKSAHLDNARAMINLSEMYKLGHGVPQDNNKMMALLKRAASLGCANGMAMLGLAYENGEVVEKNLKLAREYYEKASNENHSGALVNLAHMYKDGAGCEKNIEKARSLYEKAANLGDPGAMFNLGLLYQYELNSPQNIQLSKALFERAAEAGYVGALVSLGVIYQRGDGVSKDLEKSYELYMEAAQKGDAAAKFNLGLMFNNGLGVNEDLDLARKYYEDAANAGFSSGYLALGLMYHNGNGVTKDLNRAQELYKSAADLGNSGAMFNLGVSYQHGDGVPINIALAREWYEKSVNIGNTDAMVNLGWLYKNGLGVPKNLLKAKDLLVQAAAGENASAMLQLGAMYHHGNGVQKDLNQAYELYMKAAQAGDPDAMYNLGLMYHLGIYVSHDINQACTWYKQAIRAGHLEAMIHLGWAYQLDPEEPENLLRSRESWLDAARAGNPTGWVLLMDFDYIDVERSETKNINLLCGKNSLLPTMHLDAWAHWSSGDVRTNKIPEPPEWLDQYINEDILSVDVGDFHENKEFWRLLAIIRLYAQWQQAQHLIKHDTTLYHFTRFDVLEKLLPSSDLNVFPPTCNVLRCYHVSYMNDPSEGMRLINYSGGANAKDDEPAVASAKILKKWFGDDASDGYFYQLDNATLISELPASVFTVSFTMRADSLDLWRAYGNDGKGISVGLPVKGTKNLYLPMQTVVGKKLQSPLLSDGDVNKLVGQGNVLSRNLNDHSTRYYKVDYSDESVSKALSIFHAPLLRLEGILESMEVDADKWRKIAGKHIVEALLHILYLFKDTNYSSEEEVRAIEIHSLDSNKIRRDERLPRRLYCELPGCSLFTNPNTQLVIGPKAEDANAMIWDARHLLMTHGYGDNVTVKRSNVKYR